MRNEHDLWRFIKSGLEQVEVELQRIESSATSRGIFDINALYQGIEIWLELKFGHSPLRPEQKAWCVRRLQSGGRMWIINGHGDTLEIWKGRDAIIHGFYPKCPNWIFTRPIQWHTLRDTLFEPTYNAATANKYGPGKY